MWHDLAADGVIILHGLFVVFAVAGGLAVARWPALALIHLPAACWGALVELAGWPCPLTSLENRLRMIAGGDGYEGGFVEQYVTPLLYPDELGRTTQIMLGAIVVAVNAVVYGWVLVRWRGRRHR